MVPTLGEMCSGETMIDIDRGFEITNTFGTAFLRRYLLDEISMELYLRPSYASTWSDIVYERAR